MLSFDVRPRNRRASHVDLNARVLSNHLRNPSYKEKQPTTVIAATNEWISLALETTRLAVREDWLKSVTDFDPTPSILNGVQDQDSVILALAPDSPAFIQGDGVVLDRVSVKRIHRYNR
jgi:hypothetical protein